jgi:hypothetical protein
MQRTSEVAAAGTETQGASTIVDSAQALAASTSSRFSGEANAQALYAGDLGALAAAELTR